MTRSSCHPPIKTNMQVKAGIELPRRFSCSSASGDTEAHSDCQRRPSTTCIRVSQGGPGRFGYHRSVKTQARAGLSLKNSSEGSLPASRPGSPQSTVVPHARRPLQTAFKRLQNGHSADARDSNTHYGILSPLNTSVLGLINVYYRMLLCASLSLRTPACLYPTEPADPTRGPQLQAHSRSYHREKVAIRRTKQLSVTLLRRTGLKIPLTCR